MKAISSAKSESPPTPNDSVLQEWRESARYWEQHAPTIRAMFAPVTRALIQDADIRKGKYVLDVAAGPGEPSLTIADVVGPTGSVMCTDAVPAMVEAAQREAQRRGTTNIRFRQASADSLPFGESTFDAAVCRLGVMFLPNPLAGLSEMLRVTKGNGRISLAVWGKSEQNPFSYSITQIVSRYIESPPQDPNALSAFLFAEPGALARVLKQAGARNVTERLLQFHIEARITPREFWEMRSQTSGTLREKLEKLPSQKADEIAREVEEGLSEFFPGNQMKFPAQMLVVTGTK
ncbi:MAG TPA: class I SAM-dependent methyltransferase [Pyrinomonadaceae bacterium]|nr:class I SAM-dependent methyltransferase [Pyrinomonadaceae bacterium]